MNWLGYGVPQNVLGNHAADYIGDGGPNPSPSPHDPINNVTIATGDTHTLVVPTGGTLESDGANG